MDFLLTESEIFDNRISSINIEFMEAISDFTEELYNEYFMESGKVKKDSFTTKLNKFFANLINTFQNFHARVTG